MTQPEIQQAFDLALQRHQSGRLQEAEQLYRQILAQEPMHLGAMHYLGVMEHQQGRNQLAIDLIRQAIALNPNVPEPHNNLGLALKASGRSDEAVASYRQAILLKPNYINAFFNLGVALQDRGQFDDAIIAYRRAIALKPDHAGMHYQLACILRDQRRFDEAAGLYRKVIALNPESFDAYSNLGYVLNEIGQTNGAIAAYRQAIGLNPSDASSHNNLGNALRGRKQSGERIAAYRQAVALDPSLPEAHHNLGCVLIEMGQLDEAIATLETAITLRPGYARAYCNLANALRENGFLNEAVAALRKSIALGFGDAEAFTRLGDVLWGTRQMDAAVASYEQAIALRPDIPDVHRRLRLAREQKLGDLPTTPNANGTPLRSGAIKHLIATGDKYGFNGASVVTPGGRLLVYRRGCGNQDGLRYLWLDQEGGGGLLPELSGRGDPRLLWHDGRLIVCNNYFGAQLNDRMEIQELLIDGREVFTVKIARFERVTGLELSHREKNWCPFSMEGRLYFEYSLRPHIILAYDAQDKSMTHAFTTTPDRLPFRLEGAGPLRLNVPAVALKGGFGGNQTFLGVFHTVRGKDYYSAFYQFFAQPPFQLIAMSKNPVLWPEDSNGIVWRTISGSRVLFVQSLEIDEPSDRAILHGGDNDMACIRIELQLSSVLADMVAVEDGNRY